MRRRYISTVLVLSILLTITVFAGGFGILWSDTATAEESGLSLEFEDQEIDDREVLIENVDTDGQQQVILFTGYWEGDDAVVAERQIAGDISGVDVPVELIDTDGLPGEFFAFLIPIAEMSTDRYSPGDILSDSTLDSAASLENATVSGDEPVTQATDLDIAGQGEQATITEGDNEDITVNVTNTDDESQTVAVDLRISFDIVETQTTGELSPGESETITFENVTGELTAVPIPDAVDILTDDNGIGGSLEIESAPGEPELSNLDIAGQGDEATIDLGDDEDISTTIENVGTETGTFDVRLTVYEDVVDDDIGYEEIKTVELDPDDSEILTYESVTGDLNATDHLVEVSTVGSSVAGSLSVEEDAVPNLSDLDIAGQGADATIDEGEDESVSVTVTNDGTTPGSFDVNLEMADVDESEPIHNLPSGESETVTFENVTGDLNEGTYDVAVSTDADQITGMLTVEDAVDFSLSNLDIAGQGSDATIDEGDNEDISVDVTNDADETTAIDVDLTVGSISETESTTVLVPGATQTVTFESVTGGLDSGAFTVTTSTEDDSLDGSLTVQSPAESSFSVLDIAGQGGDATITEGANEDISVNVTNDGDQSSSFDVTLSIGDAVEETETTGTIRAGETETVTFESVTGALDPDDYTVTLSTDDDTTTGDLTVEPGDATLSNLDIAGQGDDATITEGDDEDISIDVTNDGETTQSFTLELDIDGETWTEDSDNLGSGETDTVTFEGTTADLTPDDYTVTITTSGDTATGELTVESSTDATLSNLQINGQGDDATISVGEDADVAVDVTNEGDETASFDVVLEIGEHVEETETTAPLRAGNSETVTFEAVTGDLDADDYDVTLSTTGDSITGNLTVTDAAESALSNVDIADQGAVATLVKGTDENVSIDVENIGGATDSFEVSLEIDDEVEETKSTELLAEDETETVTFEAVTGVLETGEYDVTLSTDDDTIAGDLTVELGEVTTVELAPEENQTITAGEVIFFEATALDENGNLLEDDDTEFDWNADGGAIGDDGLFDETGAGTYNVRATLNEVTSEETTVTVETGDVDSVELDPAGDVEVTADEELVFEATAFDAEDNVVEDDDTAFTWDAEGANITDAGLFNETETGIYDVTATFEEETSVETTVEVVETAIDRVELDPEETQTIAAGQGVLFEATAFDEHDNVVEDDDTEFSWDAEGGSIAADGFFDETTADTYNVTATLDDESSEETMVTVEPGDVETVALDPDTEQTITAGETVEFSATALDAFDNEVEDDNTAFIWDAESGSISDDGTFDETDAGTYNITAEFDAVTSAETLVTVEVSAVDRVELIPDEAQTITAGQGVLFEATAFDDQDNVIEDDDTEFSWDAEGGSIAADGFFDETDAGTYNVTAEFDSATSAETQVTVEPGDVETVEIDPDTEQTITAGKTVEFSATALDEFENEVADDDTAFTWDAEGGDITGDGTFDETDAGTYNITAEFDEVTSDETPVMVEAGAVDRVEIHPDEAQTITAGEGVLFEATAFDDQDNIVEDDDTEFDWDAESGDISEIGLFDETTAGTYNVIATLNEVTSEETTVTVEPGDVDSVELTPAGDVEVAAGNELVFEATAFDAFDNVAEDENAAFDWDAEGANITDGGVFNETVAGTYNVTATLNGESSPETTVEVVETDIDRIELTPDETQTITAGQGVLFEATAFDEQDNVVEDDDTEFSWDAEGSSIASDGFFDETTAGTANVTATLDGVSSEETMVTVEPGDVETVALDPDTEQAITAGETVEFSATAVDEFENTVEDDDTEFFWNAETGSISDDGTFDETDAGTYNITAEFDEVTSDETPVMVETGAVDRVEIHPDEAQTITAGEGVLFEATAFDEQDNIVEDDDNAFDWDAEGGEIAPDGFFEETGAGRYNVTASFDAETSAETQVTVEPDDVETVELGPDTEQTITAGETVEFSATAIDAFNNEVADTDSAFTWDAEGGDITGDGVFEETDTGSYSVTAEFDDVTSEETPVTVESGDVDTVELEPDTAQTIQSGGTVEFSATAVDAFGNHVEDDDNAFTWDAEGGSISGVGVFDETDVATYNVTAEFGDVTSAATPVTVEEGGIDRVELEPETPQTIDAGETIGFEASAFDAEDNVIEDDDTAFTWDAEGGSIAGDGLFEETNAGTYNVSAEISGFTSTAVPVTVEAGTVDEVVLEPASDQTITAGETIEFSATAFDAENNVVEDNNDAFDWDGEGGSISADGTFEETDAGNYTVTAELDTVESAETPVTVEASEVNRVELAPSENQTITSGEMLAFSATALDTFDNVIEGEDSEFTWGAESGSMSGDGLFDETEPGTYDVTATFEGVNSEVTAVTVEPATETPEFADQRISEDDEVTLENVSTAGVEGTVVVTYDQGGESVVAGLATGTFESENVSVTLESNIGFPDDYTASLIPTDELSEGYTPGQTLSEESSAAAVINETATVTTITGAPKIVVTGDNNAKDTTGDGLLNDITGDGESTIADVQALFEALDDDTIQANATLFNFAGINDESVSIFDVQGLFRQHQAQANAVSTPGVATVTPRTSATSSSGPMLP